MKTKTLHRLLWRLYMGRHVVVDAPEHVETLTRLTEATVMVDPFTDRRDQRTKYRLIKAGA